MGDAKASMQINTTEIGLDLHFTKEGRSVRQFVPFTYTSAGFGQRARLQCPGCFRACDCLYMGRRFLCRLCLRLTFLSQYEPAHERARMKANRIRRKLGGEGNIEDDLPEKPKWMRWATFERLQDQHEALYEQYDEGFARSVFRRLGRYF
jgi:hypothetical protein